MNALENRMNIGSPYPESWDKQERADDEVLELFGEWLDKQESDEFYFEQFLESNSIELLLTFVTGKSTHEQFKRWLAEIFQTKFENETGEQISIGEIIKEL